MAISILIALTSLALVLMAVQSVALARSKRSRKDVDAELLSLRERLQQTEQELGALCSASVGAGDHVVKLEQQVQRIIERQNLLELRAGSDRPYTQASQLIHEGADVEELVDSCGLTRGEAEFLVMMQRGAA
jgi:hypothetical protein